MGTVQRIIASGGQRMYDEERRAASTRSRPLWVRFSGLAATGTLHSWTEHRHGRGIQPVAVGKVRDVGRSCLRHRDDSMQGTTRSGHVPRTSPAMIMFDVAIGSTTGPLAWKAIQLQAIHDTPKTRCKPPPRHRDPDLAQECVNR